MIKRVLLLGRPCRAAPRKPATWDGVGSAPGRRGRDRPSGQASRFRQDLGACRPLHPLQTAASGLANAISAIQDSRKTGARYGDVSFWRPVPPAGYVALGDVTTNANNDQKPSKDSMRYTVHWGSKAQLNDSNRQARWWWWCADACTSPWSSPANGPTRRLGGTQGVAVSSASLRPAAAAAEPTTMTLIVSPSLRQPIDVGSYGDASLWCARPKDSCGIDTHTFKSDWYAPYTAVPSSAPTHSSSFVLMTPSRAHCFPLSFQPYVLKNQTKLYQTSRADAQTSSVRQGANGLPHRITQVSARPDLACSIRAEGHPDVPYGPLPATTRERRGLHLNVGRHPGPHLRLRTPPASYPLTQARLWG